MPLNARPKSRIRRFVPRGLPIAAVALAVAFAGAAPAVAQAELGPILELENEGRYDAALERLRAYLQAHPDDPRGRFLEAVLLAQSGEDAEALRRFERLAIEYPEAPEAWNNLAVLYAERGEGERAIETLERAIVTHPSYGTVFENLRRVYASRAGEVYRQALGEESSVPQEDPPLELLRDLRSVVAADARPRSADPEVEVAAASSSPGAEGGGEGEAVPGPEEAVRSAIYSWAERWSSRDVEGYLARYSPEFRSLEGRSRREWEALRRQRLTTPRFIQVAIADLEIELDGPRAVATFRQTYRSNRYADEVTKRLVLRREGDQWRILEEGEI